MGQPTQRATNYTARSNIDTAQIVLHANGQRPKRAMIRQRSRRRQRRGEPHTAQHISHSHSGIDETRPTEKFDLLINVCSDLLINVPCASKQLVEGKCRIVPVTPLFHLAFRETLASRVQYGTFHLENSDSWRGAHRNAAEYHLRQRGV